MITIKRAKRHQLVQINQLLAEYAYTPIEESHINPRDIALVALHDKKIVGVLWIGLMRQNKQGYIDCFVINSKYAKQGIGNKLALEALSRCTKLGVEKVFGIIAHGKYHDKSSMNALKMAMGSDGMIYTQVKGHIPTILSELKGTL